MCGMFAAVASHSHTPSRSRTMDGLDVSPETLLWTAASLWAVFVLTSAPGRSQLANVFSKVLPPPPFHPPQARRPRTRTLTRTRPHHLAHHRCDWAALCWRICC